jgi:hypothetical protein
MTVDNIFLFLDRVVWPDIDFMLVRRPFALVGVGFLIYGMVWKDTT